MNSLAKVLAVAAVMCSAAVAVADARARANGDAVCGLKCFRWKKCMGQLDGNENRPGQLGDTGQIVLNRCDSGNCDCAKIEEEEAKRGKAAEELAAVPTVPVVATDSIFTRNRFIRKTTTTDSSKTAAATSSSKSPASSAPVRTTNRLAASSLVSRRQQAQAPVAESREETVAPVSNFAAAATARARQPIPERLRQLYHRQRY